MTIEISATTVEVLGKAYQLKCPDNEVNALQKAAQVLEEKMREIRSVNHVLSVDRIAVLAALTMTHQLLAAEHERNRYEIEVTEKLRELNNKIETAMAARS